MYRILLSLICVLININAVAENARQTINDIFIVEAFDPKVIKVLDMSSEILQKNQDYRLIVLDLSQNSKALLKFAINGQGKGGFHTKLVVGSSEESKCTIVIIDDADNDEVKIESQCQGGLSFAMDMSDNNYHLIINH